ncbi:YheC/D-like protein [Paenibacillus taihuensis]|uniref:YheC/D-like protein n=1 Tax=Paenibacillus taihuensis TaxID=1156355 RepID=A0A3D9RRB5_9BACL|nr:YheC/YheD family protein [Paenibacillus taihuensis]REE78631.1 YheC/D-like protein [Paenibacillus taihuensis]
MWRNVFIRWNASLPLHEILIPASWEVLLTSVCKITIGSWVQHVTVTIDASCSMQSIGLSEQLRHTLSLPDTLSYDINVSEGCLRLGPVIGILAYKGKQASQEKLETVRRFLLDYASINGLVYICSLDGINPRTRTLTGYYYDPQAEGYWRKSDRLPYPDVIYRRKKYNRNRAYDHLIESIRWKVFNPYFFSKLELWRSLQEHPQLRHHLPSTQLWKNSRTLPRMLNSFRSVYLKPVRGALGDGIIRVDQLRSGYAVITNRMRRKYVRNMHDLITVIRALKRNRSYLLQQSVAFTDHKRHIDFRVIMQKNEHQAWECSAVIARYGHKKQICTNEVHQIFSGQHALEHLYGLNAHQIEGVYHQIKQICTSACQLIDHRFGVFGDVGIDIVLQSNLHIWLLEINTLHRHDVASYVRDDPDLYRKVLTTPLKFAKALAGFS